MNGVSIRHHLQTVALLLAVAFFTAIFVVGIVFAVWAIKTINGHGPEFTSVLTLLIVGTTWTLTVAFLNEKQRNRK